MTSMRKSTLREVTWDEVRLEVKKLAPDLFERAELLSPDRTYKLYEVTYPYGEMIVGDQGNFRLPDKNGDLIPIIDKNFNRGIFQELNYNAPGVGLGLIMEGKIQLFTEDEADRWISSRMVFEPGDLCALNGTMDRPHIYQALDIYRMSSGVRTPYLIPGISDRIKYSRLEKALNLKSSLPKSQIEHWELFKTLANHPDFKSNWKCRVLFFGKKWVSPQSSLKNELFRALLARECLAQTALSRNVFTLEKLWDKTVESIHNKKVDRYVISMARHIIESGFGKSVAYQVADQEDQAGPFTEIVDMLCDMYQLQKYAPIIMTPKLFDPEKNEEAFVSILLPSVNIFRKTAKHPGTLLADFREIVYVLLKFVSDHSGGAGVKIPRYNIDNLLYQFYSADARNENIILPAEGIFLGNRLAEKWERPGNQEIFSYNPFLRACVKISKARKPGHKER